MPEPDATLPAEGLTFDEPDKGDARDLTPAASEPTTDTPGLDRETAAEGLAERKGTGA